MSEMQSFIRSCLLGAAQKIERARAGKLAITKKGRNDRATSADFAAQDFIIGKIARGFPDSAVLSEELSVSPPLVSDSLFVIDPIDGTHNFIQGMPIYGVSVAHYSGGKPTAGGTYLIPQKMFFYAEKGKPATMDGKRLSVSKTAKLEDFFFLADSRLHLAVEQGCLKGLLKLEEESQHTRFIGSAIYEMGYVACGMVDAAISFRLKPYDFAAAAFIAERAGATVTDFEGRRWDLSTKRFLSSNGRQHKRIIRVLCE